MQRIIAGCALSVSLWAQAPPERGVIDSYFQQRRQQAAKASGQNASLPEPVRAALGVTLWVLSPADDSGPARIKYTDVTSGATTYWRANRADPKQALPADAKVRLVIESPNPGFLYVVNRELRTSGGSGPPRLIFPRTQLRGGENQVRPGRLVDIPSLEDQPPYFELERQSPDYAGEELLILVSPKELPGLKVTGGEQQLDPAIVAGWQSQWGVTAKQLEYPGGAGQELTSGEKASLSSRAVVYGGALPQTVYSIDSKPGDPFLVAIPLRIEKNRSESRGR